MTEQELFDRYMDEYKKQTLQVKRDVILDSVKEVLAVFLNLCQENNIECDIIKSREILDLNQEQVNEDDYLESLLVYLENAKNAISTYMINKE